MRGYREYRVPFSTREETPFIFGVTVREMAWIASGFLIGVFFSFIAFLIIGPKLQNIILCLPIIIPFIFLGFYLGKKTVIRGDYTESLDKYFIKKIRYKIKPHKYVNFRRFF
ncbi:MAG: PrgI family mobile element protein [Bacillota bacterium]|uniref:PrgI family protein n=1 Tax=Desulforamulus putei DSM 12395 TaxID=1121429 RepID=A0A1M5CME2_9FIRM|nr:PrgI family protein [Desulforamulus putei DSM 12395]